MNFNRKSCSAAWLQGGVEACNGHKNSNKNSKGGSITVSFEWLSCHQKQGPVRKPQESVRNFHNSINNFVCKGRGENLAL